MSTGSEIYAKTVDLVTDLSRNPIVELVIALALVERLEKMGVFTPIQGTIVEGSAVGLIGMQVAGQSGLGDAAKSLLGLLAK